MTITTIIMTTMERSKRHVARLGRRLQRLLRLYSVRLILLERWDGLWLKRLEVKAPLLILIIDHLAFLALRPLCTEELVKKRRGRSAEDVLIACGAVEGRLGYAAHNQRAVVALLPAALGADAALAP